MTNQQPNWADLNVAPAAKPTKLQMVGIGCGILFGATMGLAALGAIVGPPPKTHTSAAVVATDTPTSTPVALASVTPTPLPPSSTPTPTPTPSAPPPTVAQPTPKPTPAPPRVDLVLSDGLTGTATQADDVLPPIRSDSIGDAPNDGPTQCVLPKDDLGAWVATVTFHAAGMRWEITIENPNFSYPNVGSHPGVFSGDKPGLTPNAVSLDIGSDKDPRTGNMNAWGTPYGYSYYTAPNHNDPTVTVNSNMTSGTIDAWLTPADMPDFGQLVFHLAGRWSCR